MIFFTIFTSKIISLKDISNTNNNTVFTIAEIAQAHEGSLGMAHSYIETLAKAGVSAVKFQMHIAKAESSKFEEFRVNFSYQDKTRYDYWERMAFTFDQWESLKQHCENLNIAFIVSVFSNLAVEWCEKLGVECYKIGSGEINNLLLIEKIAQTKKPIILSSGMSNYLEIDRCVDLLSANEISILQCNTAYPTPPKRYGLNIIQELKSRYNNRYKIGYSDHSGKISTGVAATALGAEILEFHVAFSKDQFGPDTSSSLTIDQVRLLINGIKDISLALNNPVDKNNTEGFEKLKSIFGKSLAVNKNISAGQKITFEDLEAKKPKGYGIDPIVYHSVIGKVVKKDKKAWDFLNTEDLQ